MRELTSMQAACWMGRGDHSDLGGVSAHLYAEFDGQAIDLPRLVAALGRLGREHGMLRACVTADGMQALAAADKVPHLEVEDFTALEGEALAQRLEAKRQQWTHQRLDLATGQAVRFSISLFGAGDSRLHVDADMIAVDPSSFRVLMEDLALFYESPDAETPPTPSFFEWCDRARDEPWLKAARERDRDWWREQLPNIAPAPSLPRRAAPAGAASSHRLCAWLAPEQRQALRRLAKAQRLTLSGLMLGLFAQALSAATGDRRFRLNVPVFWRPPLLEGAERIIGEFANLVLLDVDLAAAPTTGALCRNLAAQLLERAGHCAYPGVNLMRDLSRHHRSPQIAPVVFTAALDMLGGELFSERVRRAFGAMNWVISQGPQVALDAQIVSADGGVLINWDIRLDALPQDWITQLFNDFVALATAVAADPAALERPLAQPEAETPLSVLQQAYLLGRTAQLPLGGVAMQEFREYHGTMDPALLRARLGEMVRRHDCLRTVIDVARLRQRVRAQPRVNLREVDLRALSPAAAQQRVAAAREDYAHALFDLEHSPWELTLFQLPDDALTVFVRFDALIVDGRSIAALMLELFQGVVEPSRPAAAVAAEVSAEARKADALYWKNKLADCGGAPRLPWRKPLDQLGVARYERQSLTVSAERFERLSKLGNGQRFFKNTTVMALVLEVLSHWLDEGGLCVAVPVAPLPSGGFSNRSSFIAVAWPAGLDSLAERGRRLQADVMEGLQHLAFSGVDLARMLFESHGPGPALPVVVTNGLSWPAAADGAMRQIGGLTQTPQVAMDLRFSARADGALVFDIDYARDALEPALVGAVLSALERAIEQVVDSGVFEAPAGRVLDYGHYRLNSVEAEARREDFLGRIAAQIFDPDNARVALISGQRRIRYGELGEAVSRAMAALKARGVSAGQVVAVCLPRSPEHTISTLACAFSGVVWVPIDAASPEERLRYLLDNCRPNLVVAAQPLPTEHARATPEQLLVEPAPLAARGGWQALSLSETPAYYLYTSGTTGKPKCVVLCNRATANVIGSTLEHWQVSQRDVCMSVTPLHHDMSVFDVLGSLSAGATLVLPEAGEEKDAVRWNQLVDEHGVTLWCTVPAMLEMLLSCRREGGLQSLRLVAQGGDYIKPSIIADLRAALPAARLLSLGGPTETTIWSIWHDILAEDCAKVPYGRPLPGNRYWLLNERGEHCPAGVAGRIHTAGVNLALGYLENGELTQHDFVTVRDEAGQEARAFRTSDCGRYRPDGVMMFDSRVNGYVKVRGVRVSLPDIEMELIKHPALAHVLVVDVGDERQGELGIGALYVAKPGAEASAADLREHARRVLPQSHVPTRFLRVEQLPLSQNGKPDRRGARALLQAPAQVPAQNPVAPPAPAVAVAEAPAPATRHRRPVLDIYLGVLGRSYQELADELLDFSSMGLLPQHLKAIAARMRETFAVELSPGQLLRCRNVADVERLLVAGQP